ncbi:MAG: NADH:flavin oxidoreductase/NADH oxidase [Aquabacterium sp.]|nr:NADH:flavin oxidoreductase/NADH oxidase [Aquabacterium sp.]
MSHLFTSLALGPLTLPNRIVIAPMCQYSAVDGNATDWHLIHLGQLALSGAGLLIVEATAVSAEGRITPGCLGLYNDTNEAALARVLQTLRHAGSPMPLAIQLGHAGRKASSHAPWDGGQLIPADQGGWPTVAPSALPHGDGEAAPVALDGAGLQQVQDDFVAAAQRAVRLGFQAIELHAAHGYLLHQFLSPIANQRSDGYGGSAANRMRFPLQVFSAVRAAVPAHVAVGMRLSATDWVDGGWGPADSVAFTRELKRLGGDFIHVSSGGVSARQQIPLGPGYQVHLADQIRREAGLPTIAVGLITDAQQAEDVIAGGQADAVAIARGILYDPHWPWHAAAALGAQVQAPKQYWRSQPRGMAGLFGDVRIGMR